MNAITRALISVPDPSDLVADVLGTRCLREHRKLVDAVIERIESRTRKWPLNRFSLEAILAHPDLIPKKTAERAIADFVSSPKTRYRELDIITERESIAESETVQSAVADSIRKASEPLLILEKLKDSKALMGAEAVRLAIESSVPGIVEQIRQNEYPWLVIALIKDVEHLTSNHSIQKEIANAIRTSEEPQRIIHAMGESEILLSSPDIKSSIIARESDKS